jgi:hypothetical protein
LIAIGLSSRTVSGVSPALQRCEIDERLERRARLALGDDGAVVLTLA